MTLLQAEGPAHRFARMLLIGLTMTAAGVHAPAQLAAQPTTASQQEARPQQIILPGIIDLSAQQGRGGSARVYAGKTNPINHDTEGNGDPEANISSSPSLLSFSLSPDIPLQPDPTRYGEKRADLSRIPPNEDPRISLLQQGKAQRFPEDEADTPALIEAERTAIESNLGLWADPCCRIIPDTQSHDHTQEWRIVRGTVYAVKSYSKKTYVNFSSDWRRDFTLTLSSSLTEELNPKSWEGKVIEARGWIHWSNGPTIDLFSPSQIYVHE